MLSVAEHMALQVEDVRWPSTGPKDTVIRETLGISPVRHSQLVDALIDRVDAEETYPALVHRLRRLRDLRAAQRGRRAS